MSISSPTALSTMIGVLYPGSSDALTDLDAAQIGQPEIGQNQRRLSQERLIETALAVRRENGPEPFPLEQHADRVAEIFVVVNNKDRLHRHGDSNLYRCVGEHPASPCE